MSSRLLLLATLLSVLTLSAGAEEGGPEFRGYYKNLLAVSRTPAPEGQPFTLDLNRLRLELRDRPWVHFDYELQYDHEVLLGSVLRTAAFARQKLQPSATYFDLDSSYADDANVHARHRLHRAYGRVHAGDTSLSLGRQRIAWGSGRIWNPIDLLNPYDPTQLERGERTGVDAVLLEQAITALGSASAVYVPEHGAADSWAIRGRSNRAGTDFAAVAGRIGGNDIMGGEFAGRIGNAGVYGEGLWLVPEDGSGRLRAVLGAEYAFVNTLLLGAEVFWNGSGAGHARDYDHAAVRGGSSPFLARRYLGLRAAYELTPLLRLDGVAVANLDDGSVFAAPMAVYALTAEVDLGAGGQLCGGAPSSEYGARHNLGFISLQWFF